MGASRTPSEPDRTLSYDGRRFRLVMSGSAPAGRTILLDCRQAGDIVVGSYSGDGVEHGSLLAVVRAMACLEGRFHHLLDGARVETGRCWATPQHTARGAVRLYFEWQMGAQQGVSIMEEVGA